MNDASAGPLAPALQARHKRLFKRIQQLPPNGSRPLTVSGKVAGWVTANATRHIAGMPGVHIEDEAVHVVAMPHRRLSVNAVLANIATALKDAGCLRGWRNELLDVVGEGKRLGVMERAAMRPLGLLTQAVHLNAWSLDGSLWVARRAHDKTTDPGMWDTLVGGLAGAGERLDISLLRESNEEAGLTAADIENRSPLDIVLRMHRRLPEGYQVENVLLSDCVLADSVQPRNLDGEVCEIRKVPVPELLDMIHADAFTLEAELVVLESLRRRLAAADR